MNNRQKTFFLLLIVALLFIGYALSPITLGAGGFTLKKFSVELPSFLTASAEADTLQADTTATEAIVLPDTANQRILFFGDSMLEGLSRRFGDYAAENGHELDVVLWYSSSTKLWAESDTLQYYLRKYDPTFVVLCLGSNELFVRDLDERDRAIGVLLNKLGKRPFVWISPPNWKEDTGINDLIIKHVGPSRYFDSRHLTLERGRDHAHPTFDAARTWMDSVATWLSSPQTAHPIRLNLPQGEAKPSSLTLLAPV